MQNIKEEYLERAEYLLEQGYKDPAAAHGKHDEYTENQVKDFLSGLRRFIGEYLG